MALTGVKISVPLTSPRASGAPLRAAEKAEIGLQFAEAFHGLGERHDDPGVFVAGSPQAPGIAVGSQITHGLDQHRRGGIALRQRIDDHSRGVERGAGVAPGAVSLSQLELLPVRIAVASRLVTRSRHGHRWGKWIQ